MDMANGNGSEKALRRAVRNYIATVEVDQFPDELVQNAVVYEDNTLVQEIRDSEDMRRELRSAVEHLHVEATLQPSLDQILAGLRQQRRTQPTFNPNPDRS